MNQAIKVQKMIDNLTHEIDSRAEEIIKELQGQKIKDVKNILKANQFEMNPTKKKLVDVLEEKVSSTIDEQKLLFETDKVLGAEYSIKNGDKTPNQVRVGLGLPPLKAHIGDERIISKD